LRREATFAGCGSWLRFGCVGMPSFEEFVVQTGRANSLHELYRMLSDSLGKYGYDNLVVAKVTKSRRVMDVPYKLFPEGYAEYYRENHCARVDPVLNGCLSAQRPFYWSEVTSRRALTKQQRRFLRECELMGVRSGFTLPLHGPFGQLAVLSASRRSDADEDRERLPLLAGLCTQFWTRWLELSGQKTLPDGLYEDVHLTSREIECIRWCKEGKSASEISTVLNISEKTAQFHVSNAMAKLGANNRMTAVVMALQLGLIDL